MPKQVLILGGAGFLGSHLARRFVAAGDRVTVVDGLMPETGGSLDNIADVRQQIELRQLPIEEVADLPAMLATTDTVVDAMAWTRHRAGLQNPLHDMRLNLASHLVLIQAMRRQPPPLVIYLGSRSQYGRTERLVITEDDPLLPLDPQGVHKAAAEQHFRNYAAAEGYAVVSLRLPNCFGEHQPVSGDDIGLVGGFVRTLCEGGTVTVYGENRRRALLYAGDAAEIVVRIAGAKVVGFVPLNVGGCDVGIRDLAIQLRAMVGRGTVVDDRMPAEIAALEAGSPLFDQSRLRALVGEPPQSDLDASLRRTVAYFRGRLQ